MNKQQSGFSVLLFYSYCHKNEDYRNSMEQSLALLKTNGLLEDWYDHRILPGESITEEAREKMNEAHIIVFLLSQEFIASDECMKEWEYAKKLARKNKMLYRIPIILTDCAWKDLIADNNIKALPKDGSPVAGFEDKNTAWQQVYESIKEIITKIRNAFTPKEQFLQEMQKTDFVSQEHVKLQDTFVFPTLRNYSSQTKSGRVSRKKITNPEQLLRNNFPLIHGEEMSGKTALAKYLFLHLVKKSKPVLYVDLKEVSRRPLEEILRDFYSRQFDGDYSLWKLQKDKILILDDLSSAPNLIEFVVSAKEFFEKIIITLSSDVFNSFFRDEARLVDFQELKIEPLTHGQQEDLIRKRLELSNRDEPITDGFIDQVRRHVNSVITSKKIVPRYPFFILSILQLYEGFMPSNLSITSYGHCYYILIVATLTKAGISSDDKDINACFNFAENLAFEIYQHSSKENSSNALDLDTFIEEYKEKFFIFDSILNRLKDKKYGIVTADGRFRTPYMYYFFLGRFLSKKMAEHKVIIREMCERSYVTSNYLTLLFIIHHTSDKEIIDEILINTMFPLEAIQPAILNPEETKRFGSIRNALSKNILSEDSVETERARMNKIRDLGDDQDETEDDTAGTKDNNPSNDCYKILKNNEILGQVLKNQSGILEKTRIEEIIEIIADGGLRLINISLNDEEKIAESARYIHKKHPEHDISMIKDVLGFLSFLWTMINIEKVASAINHPEIRKAVNEVVRRNLTPAYELIGYFSHLDSSKELSEEVKNELEALLKKHRDPFVKGVLSIKTQGYMNTHHSKATAEQSVCSLLGIKYTHRIRPPA